MQRSTVARLARPSTVRRYASPAVGSAVPGPSASPSKDRSTNQRPRKAPTGVPNEVGLAAAALLPAVPLYRRILRAHNHLPIEMKSLGDSYVKDEFRRHTDIDNPLHIIGFLTQWKLYLDALETEKGVPTSFRGKRLDMEQFEKLSEDQLYQLHELMTVTREMYDPEKAQAQPPGGNQTVNEAVEDALDRTRKADEGGEGEGDGKGR